MDFIKNILFWNLNFVPFSVLNRIQPSRLLLPVYHIVSDDKVPHVANLYSYKKIKQFEKDLDFFLKHFNPISFQDLQQSLNHNTPLKQRSILLSLDDGYREVFDIVAPILKKKSIPSIFFINTAFVDNENMFYRNKASLLIDVINNNAESIPVDEIKSVLRENEILNNDLKSAILSIPYHQKKLMDDIGLILNVDFKTYLKEKEPYLTSFQINKLIEDGFDIGSHSIDHPLYKYLPLGEQIRQTKESLDFLAEKFKLPYRIFAFPHNDKGAKELIKKTHFNGDVETSFGTAGLSKGYCPNNLQRQSMENTNKPAKLIYKNLFRYEVLKQLKSHSLVSGIVPGKYKKMNSGGSDEKSSSLQGEKIRIKMIKIGDLVEFTENYNKNKTPEDLAVISNQRAIAGANNPFADIDDIGLILAYLGNRCVGYLGMMPGIAKYKGTYEKMYFPTTWLVSDIVRGRSVGSLLMKAALSLDKALIITGFNNNTRNACLFLGFEYIKTLHYSQLDFQKCDVWFIRFFDKFFTKFKKHDKSFKQRNDQSLYNYCKRIIYSRISKKTSVILEGISYREVEIINYESKESNNSEDYRFYRGIKAANWMLKYPWVKSKDQSLKETGTKYFFSEVREVFNNVALEIFSKEKNKILGYMVLSISQDRGFTMVKLLDHELSYHKKNEILLALVIKYASDVLADKVDITNEVAQPLLTDVMVKSHLLRKKERPYLFNMSDMTCKIARVLKNINPDYCDGDMPFS